MWVNFKVWHHLNHPLEGFFYSLVKACDSWSVNKVENHWNINKQLWMLVTNYKRSVFKSYYWDVKINGNAMAGLKDKVVLITGASSGIGRGTAVHFASLGSRISLVARNLDHLKAVAEECKAAGAKVSLSPTLNKQLFVYIGFSKLFSLTVN